MEFKITAKQMLQFLKVLAYIIFFGLCVDAGGVLVNTVFALAIDSQRAAEFWSGADLSQLIDFDQVWFGIIGLHMTIVAVLKAIMFYIIVKMLQENRLDLSQPFSPFMGKFVSWLCYFSLAIGCFSIWGTETAKWLSSQNVFMPNSEVLKLGGADVWIFMGIILMVIAQIFKRGIEIQRENELTV